MAIKLTNESAEPIFTKNFNELFDAWCKRTDKGSQGLLSRLIGVTQSRISYWVHGMSLPTFVNLYNLSQVFECDLKDFYKPISE